jgi:hypothetical protein
MSFAGEKMPTRRRSLDFNSINYSAYRAEFVKRIVAAPY